MKNPKQTNKLYMYITNMTTFDQVINSIGCPLLGHLYCILSLSNLYKEDYLRNEFISYASYTSITWVGAVYAI